MQFGPGTVEEHDFLSENECAELSQKILALEPHWEARLGPYQFSTLGCATYLDVAETTANYAQKSSLLNPLLREAFQDLYERLRQYFDGILDGEVYLDAGYSYPGFHLFRFEGNEVDNDHPADRAHFDYQFAQLFPNFAEAKSMPLTFTVPIEEPSTGTSLEVWDLRPEGHAEINFEHKEYARNNPSRTVLYRVGRIYIHDGLSLHAMGRVAAGTQGRRITLQGHAYRTERGWLLYW